ncbi:tRNA1(Val) (adenine(37)-N6)-methyltransferase [Aminipila luticellarii]|uniref:tRNA1(Val) (Adenine(37)-N6)-methyltransferase n=1 Tax=Aminipila luticellarii TaxID=2507160 RepID=A0A410PWL5_9FIRM|nr:tRNA1(Val) (adenine(37)-N6)-methyltransferase [Aminipila luticellarii]QAT43329.1 tRNA1(Val) (adenine(37)-N6)-methyltransferase [Aminipila luticellarii]
MKDNFLMQGERLDEIGFGELKLIQKPEEFCYGVDAVILAAFASKAVLQSSRKFTRAIDLGTGTGIIPIILSHKTLLKEIVAVEIQHDSFDRACRNVELNMLKERISVIHEDVSRLEATLPDLKGSFDLVTANPPYMAGGGGMINENSAKRIARHETTADLQMFIKISAALLREKGELFMVHRPSRLVDICEACRKYKVEPKELRFVSPNKSAKPNILLIRCVKSGNPELKMLDPLYIYDETRQDYTDELMKIYER